MNRAEEYAFLMRPGYEPLPLEEGSEFPSLAALWSRAKEVLAMALQNLSFGCLAKRTFLRRREHAEFRNWMGPVFALVHSCILGRAIDWLTGTEEGRRLLRDTPKTIPAQPVRVANTCVSIPHPGWHTIAAHRPAPAPEPEPEPKLRSPAWRMNLGVMPWPGIVDVDEIKPPKIDVSRFILTCREPDEQIIPRPEKREPTPVGLRLSRMIEAVSSVLDNPEPAIRRVARALARMTLDDLRELHAPLFRDWHHAIRDARTASNKLYRALRALIEMLERGIDPPEPRMPEPG